MLLARNVEGILAWHWSRRKNYVVVVVVEVHRER